MTTATILAVHNKVIYRRFIDEIFNEGRLEKLDEVLSPAYIYHDAPEGAMPGPEGVKRVVTMFRTAFPDLKITIDDQVAEGDKVCSRTTMRGTHQGTIFGVPPTGRSVSMHGMTMARIADGRVVESWVKNDLTGLMRQLV
jgi:steroid delta-isomerase-like uncharacterized protein